MFRAPAMAPDEDTRSEAGADRPRLTFPSHRRTVLLLDHDALRGATVAETLVRRGHQVMQAYTYADVVRLARRGHPDAVVLGDSVDGALTSNVLRDLESAVAPRFVGPVVVSSPVSGWSERESRGLGGTPMEESQAWLRAIASSVETVAKIVPVVMLSAANANEQTQPARMRSSLRARDQSVALR